MKNVVIKLVSKDLPFAIERFCEKNNITNVMTLSDYKDANHALRYGVAISAPSFLEGFFGRVVYIANIDGTIAYKEVVSEITNEPNYDRIIKTVNLLTKKQEAYLRQKKQLEGSNRPDRDRRPNREL